MAINKNHEFEELDGIKCAIVERNITAERVTFLERILSFNKYQVVVVPVAPKIPPAAIPDPAASDLNDAATADVSAEPALFTVGVTDLTFNCINAIFGRLLRMPGGSVVTLAYWQEKEKEPHDEVPYFEFPKGVMD
jgi:hypothetical protein